MRNAETPWQVSARRSSPGHFRIPRSAFGDMTHHRAAELRASGMSEAAAMAKGELFARAERALAIVAPHPAKPLAVFVPGRVEVLGKHTDYAGGRSLLAAVERGVCLVALVRADRTVRVIDGTVGELASFALDPAL